MAKDQKVYGLGGLFNALEAKLGKLGKFPRIAVEGLSDTQKQLVILESLKGSLEQGQGDCHPRDVVVILPSLKELQTWAGVLGPCLNTNSMTRLYSFPHFSTWGNDRYVNHSTAISERISCLAALHTRPDLGKVILSTLPGMAQYSMPQESFLCWTRTLKVGSQLDQDELIAHLSDAGYLQSLKLQEHGSFTVRGALVDIFPPSSRLPVRVEFLGDQLSSIRSFSSHDQRAVGSLQEVTLCPASEVLLPKKLSK